MSISELRLFLIDKIMHMEEGALLNIQNILSNSDSDWWELLTEKEQEEIDEGLTQAEEGKQILHKDVMKKFYKWK